MSEDERFKSVIQEIEEIFLFLTNQEPTPDDEIDARDKLIEKFTSLKPLKPKPSHYTMIENILIELEGWDTLDLWFKEVKGMSEKIGDFINSFEQKELIIEPESKPTIDADMTIETKEKKEVPQIDITEIVSQVSEQFNQEISSLKEKIDVLKDELDHRESEVKNFSQSKQVRKIIPKKTSKLEPPKIRIPSIKPPKKAPKIKLIKESAEEEIKKEPEVQEEKISSPDFEGKVITPNISQISVEPPKIPSEMKEGIVKPVGIPPERPKLTPIITEEPSSSDQSEKPFKSTEELPVEKEPIYEEINFTPLPKEKGKRIFVQDEIIDLTPLPEEEAAPADKPQEETIIPLPPEEKPIRIQKPSGDFELTPLPPLKPETAQEIKEETDLTPVIRKKPKLSPIAIEEVDTEEINSSSTDLFNVFSSVGTKQEEQSEVIPEPVEIISQKESKKEGKKESKKKQKSEITVEEPTITIPSKSRTVKKEPELDLEALPKDKDSLYQQLIAFEGRRYSLEKAYKDLTKNYSIGKVDEFEFNNQSENLKQILNEVSSSITEIRRIISSL